MQISQSGIQLFRLATNELGLDIDPALPHFLQFFEMLSEANQSLNLTSIRAEKEIILKHFVDSLSCLVFEGFKSGMRVIDVGTGGGFPGLPLAFVRRQIRFDLMDSTKKKIDFVQTVVDRLQLDNVEPIWGRSEELSREIVKRETYDAVVTRAVASLQVVSELTLPLVKVGGFVLVQKASNIESEIEPALSAIDKLGGKLKEVIPFELPIIKDRRSLVIIEKIRNTPEQYPRKTGVPAKNPLS